MVYSCLLIGGERLEDQFAALAVCTAHDCHFRANYSRICVAVPPSQFHKHQVLLQRQDNVDLIIATPGQSGPMNASSVRTRARLFACA